MSRVRRSSQRRGKSLSFPTKNNFRRYDSLGILSSFPRHRVTAFNYRHPNERTALQELYTDKSLSIRQNNDDTVSRTWRIHFFYLLFRTYSLCTAERWNVSREWRRNGSMISWNKKRTERFVLIPVLFHVQWKNVILLYLFSRWNQIYKIYKMEGFE